MLALGQRPVLVLKRLPELVLGLGQLGAGSPRVSPGPLLPPGGHQFCLLCQLASADSILTSASVRITPNPNLPHLVPVALLLQLLTRAGHLGLGRSATQSGARLPLRH